MASNTHLSAAHQVFNIAELAEEIALHLPAIDILLIFPFITLTTRGLYETSPRITSIVCPTITRAVNSASSSPLPTTASITSTALTYRKIRVQCHPILGMWIRRRYYRRPLYRYDTVPDRELYVYKHAKAANRKQRFSFFLVKPTGTPGERTECRLAVNDHEFRITNAWTEEPVERQPKNKRRARRWAGQFIKHFAIDIINSKTGKVVWNCQTDERNSMFEILVKSGKITAAKGKAARHRKRQWVPLKPCNGRQ